MTEERRSRIDRLSDRLLRLLGSLVVALLVAYGLAREIFFRSIAAGRGAWRLASATLAGGRRLGGRMRARFAGPRAIHAARAVAARVSAQP